MKIIVPALAAAFIGTLGAGSAAQAAVSKIDFSAVAECPVTCTGITYTGATLDTSTALDLDGSTWLVDTIGAGDKSGLVTGDSVTVAPTSFTYGSGGGPVSVDIVKTWTGALGTFTETLTSLSVITRGSNTLGLDFTGTVTGGAFHDSPATMDLSLTQAGGPGNVVSASLTNSASTSTIPEPSTWVMMALGFGGLAYAAVRRKAKDRSALAI